MLKASALYIVIVIALVMALICSSLIVSAYFYKLQYQKTFRYTRLQSNLHSALNILLETKADLKLPVTRSLFGEQQDTVQLQRNFWGIYQLATAKSIIQSDTLGRAFFMAPPLDSVKRSALYVIDEDRALSVSGKTSIKGPVSIPKAGIQEAYVNNQGYQGDKRLIIGTRHDSQRSLPPLDEAVLKYLRDNFNSSAANTSDSKVAAATTRSFLKGRLTFTFGKEPQTLSGRIEGHILVQSDTIVTIEASAQLKNILVFAKSITVKSGFQGQCQLFATDSIIVESHCNFHYPSALGVLRFGDEVQGQEKLSIGEASSVNGVLFTYEKAKNTLLPFMNLGKQVKVSGIIYSQGLLNYKDGVEVKGGIYTSRFLYQTDYTRYENYLINLRIDGPALSRYYLSSDLLPAAGTQKKVLEWLDTQ